MPRPRVLPLDSDVRVVALGVESRYDVALDTRIETLWREELSSRGSDLFDGMLLSFVDRTGSTIRGRFVEYRAYVAQRRDPALAPRLAIRPLSVSGVLMVGSFVAFGRRPERVTQYPGWLELVPSGSIDRRHLAPDGSVDFRVQLLDELREEVGVNPSDVVSVTPFALILDDQENTVDLCAAILLSSRRADPPGSDDAYTGLNWVPVGKLEAFLAAHRTEIVPTSIAILEAYGLRDAG